MVAFFYFAVKVCEISRMQSFPSGTDYQVFK